MKKNKRKPMKLPKIHTMDIILIVIFATLVVFTIKMIQVFEISGSIPDTLVTCVFAALGGECGIMGWIMTTKTKKQQRKWDKEDSKKSENKTPEEPHSDDSEGF